MFRTKKSILLLPLASLVIYAPVVGFVFLAAGTFDWYGGDIFNYTLGLTIFCCTCSAASGTFAVARKADLFPKLAWVMSILLILSALELFLAMFVLMPPMSQRSIGGLVLLASLLLCFISFLVTLFVIIREAIRRTQDFHTWVIFVTQLMWIGFAFVSFMLAAAISASC